MKQSTPRRFPSIWLLAMHLLAVLVHFQPAAAAAADGPLLTGLVPSTGTLSPAFSSKTFLYGIAVPAGTSFISLIPTTAGPDASVTVNGVPADSGGQSGAIPLVAGGNDVTVQVTAQDGLASRSYHVTVLVPPTGIGNLTPITDITPAVGIGSGPANFTAMGKWMFFTATSSACGTELWKSDGTAAGTVMVRDIVPGVESSSPTDLIAVGNILYFRASDGDDSDGDDEGGLWKSDGTAAGTVRLMTPHEAGNQPRNVSGLTAVGDTLYFRTSDHGRGDELWKSDGTAEGTVPLFGLARGAGPFFLTAMGGNLYYAHSNAIWKSDGTPEGTIRLGVFYGEPERLTAAGDNVYFSTRVPPSYSYEVWKTNGTAAGTVPFKKMDPGGSSGEPLNIKAMGGILYFHAPDATHGTELWKSDGTAAGTVLVKDINPGTRSSYPGELTVMNGTLYFRADNNINGRELWKSDGTEAGTVLVKDIFPVGNSSEPEYLTVAGDTLFFRTISSPSSGGTRLWKSDGTSAGTVMVKEINMESGSEFDHHLAVLGDMVLFAGWSRATGTELWKSDGTEEGTFMVRDLQRGSVSTALSDLTRVGSTLYFHASGSGSSTELWKTDGTVEGTVRVKDIYPGSDRGDLSRFTALGDMLYFLAYNGYAGTQLWRSDGTAAGTIPLKQIYNNSPEFLSFYLVPYGGHLYFNDATDDIYHTILWKTDGTVEGTVIVKESPWVKPAPSNPGDFTVMGDSLYFTAYLADSGTELWKTDGTDEGTVIVKDIIPGVRGSVSSPITKMGGNLYFPAYSGLSDFPELWKSDGTAEGTVMVKDLLVNYFDRFHGFRALGDFLFFYTSDSQGGFYMWKSDGTEAGTTRLGMLFPEPGIYDFLPPTAMGGRLYFSAYDEQHGSELWRCDGTAEGTVRISDILSGKGSSKPMQLTVVGDALYFTASDGIHGVELWKSDGTEEGTTLVLDIAAGSGGSAPGGLTSIGTKLYFTATTEAGGQQLYVHDTVGELPRIHHLQPGSVTKISATLGGTVTTSGSAPITARGIIYSPATVNADPRIDGTGVVNLVNAGGVGTFETGVSGLTLGVTYAFRAYATTALGTAYSPLGVFTTLSEFSQAESWRAAFFGNHENIGIAADSADPDQDGIVNLLERAFGLSPLVAGTLHLSPGTGTSGLPVGVTVQGQGQIFHIRYVRLKASANPGLTYTPQFSSGLNGSWEDYHGDETAESINADWERVTVLAPAMDETRCFARVRVAAVP